MPSEPIKLTKEDDVWLLPSRELGRLTGYPEYEVVVHSYMIGEEFVRLVAPVMEETWVKGDDGNELVPVPRWIDTTTGTVYSLDGNAFGPLRFASEPRPTGRDVPAMSIRTSEARVRYMNAQLKEADDADTE